MKPSTLSLRYNNYQYFATFTSSILFFVGYNIHFFNVVVGLRIIHPYILQQASLKRGHFLIYP